MSTKKITVQIEDTGDYSQSTSPPESLTGKESSESQKGKYTGIPESSNEGYTETDFGKPELGKIGRTYSDFFTENINNPRLITTILFFVPFPFFALNINSIRDMYNPFYIGIFLNIIWHSFSLLPYLFRKIFDKNQ